MIVRFAHKEEWDAAEEAGEYRPPELDERGYIGCAMPSQAAAVADAQELSGEDGLVLLWIHPPKVKGGVLYERLGGDERADLYPHIRGPLNVDAVLRVDDLPAWEPGRFVVRDAPSLPD